MNMKHTARNLIIASVIALSVGSAFAKVSDQSISALQSRNWTAAESSLKNDLKQDNQDPKVWYNLAQVLNHARKPEEAMKALNNAVHLDKTMSFARSRQNVFALRDTIQSNIKVVNNTQPVNNTTRPANNSYNVPAVPSTPSVVANKPTSQVPVSQSKAVSHEDKGGFGIFALLLVLIGAGGIGFYFFTKNKEKKNTQADQSQKMVKLEEMFNDTTNKVSFIKAMDKSATDLGRKMSSLKDDILSAKASSHIADYQFSELQSQYRKLVNRFDNEEYDAPVISQPVQQRQEEHDYSRPRNDNSSSYGRNEPQRSRNDNGYNGGSTTVVNNHYGNSNSGSDMLNGIVMGSILANAGHHDTVIEREVVREQPRQDSYNYGNQNDDFADNNDDEVQEFNNNSSSDWGDSNNNNSYENSNDYQDNNSLDDFATNDSSDSDDDWAR